MPLINCKRELKLKWKSVVFCLQLVMKMLLMIMIMPLILLLLSKTQNYKFL